MDRSTVPPLPSSLLGLMENHDSFDFLPSHYAELLSKLAKLYSNEHQELKIMREEINKLKIKLVSLSQRMVSADLTIEDIPLLLELLKNRSTFLSQEVDAQLERPPSSAKGRKIYIPTGAYG